MSSRSTVQTEILSGHHSVAEALTAGRRRFYEIYVAGDPPGRRIEKLARRARGQDILVTHASRDEIRRLSGNPHHQDIAARTDPFPLTNYASLFTPGPQAAEDSLLLILDSIEDPQNLGALIRTAVCTGVSGILIAKDRSAAPTPAVSRASAGALEHARFCIVTNLVNTMKDLKKNHFWIIGLEQQEGAPVFETDMTGPRTLVIGGEDTGIRPLVRRQCDFLCHIPQTGPINSLNASVAGGIALYEALRQRLQNKHTTRKGSASNEQC